jgi:hypothetical protein
MDKHTPGSNVVQLAGPGVAGREGDPPLFHFDLPTEDAGVLIADPLKYLAGIGITTEQGIAPDGTLNVTFTDSSRAWDGSQWISTLAPGASVTATCCYVSGSQTICHQHAQ